MSGNLTLLHAFSGSDGAEPPGARIQANNGSFYDTSSGGGANGLGTVFKMDASGNITVLRSLSAADGTVPLAKRSTEPMGLRGYSPRYRNVTNVPEHDRLANAAMHRRELFKILAAGAMLEGPGLAQHDHPAGAAADPRSAYRPRFFSDPEYHAIDGLTDVIIPSDAQSAGAHVAGVAFYIDTVLHYADSPTQAAWRTGITALEAATQDRFGTPAAQCNRSQYEELVTAMAEHESEPATELDRFFVRLKQITIDGYFLSDIGRRDYLGYQGDTVLAEFPGCTHPEHQS
jgi:uncharacterized repeat protein (TIGR03803 family)